MQAPGNPLRFKQAANYTESAEKTLFVTGVITSFTRLSQASNKNALSNRQ
jgi:hypothetical protein